MRGALVLLLLVSSLAGCVDPPNTPPAVTDPDPTGPPSLPLMTRTRCSGYNAFMSVDEADLRPFVPANWTFTTLASGRALLRIHVVGCDEARHLILSTPMFPDAASQPHHDNPDVVIALYTDDPNATRAWVAAGFPAQMGDVAWAEDRSGDTVRVSTPNGTVLDLATIDPHPPPPDTYQWPAVYASGRDVIRWAWGQEDARTRPVGMQEVTFGPAAPFPGLSGLPWSARAWVRFDVQYEAGTPSE